MLRDWVLWRMDFYAFIDRIIARRRWFDKKIESLRDNIATLDVPADGTGDDSADAFIREYLPCVV